MPHNPLPVKVFRGIAQHWRHNPKCSLTPLQRFTKRLHEDAAAVQAAMTLPWSHGPVEGHINRLKRLKRQMCRWARFDLLA
jgi:transposase